MVDFQDGCFDLFHYGHANAFRQSKSLGDLLIVGCHSDQDIQINKGPSVLSQSDRVKLISGCRWVNEVIQDAPYNTSLDFINQYSINYVAHGDDITTDSDGLDTYRYVKEAGIYLEFKRTLGVSTTDAITRILLDSSPSITHQVDFQLGINLELLELFIKDSQIDSKDSMDSLIIRFQPVISTQSIEIQPSPSFRKQGYTLASILPLHQTQPSNLIYIHGTFDLFSTLDLDYLKKLTQNDQFKLIIGIWGGDDSKEKLGKDCILSFQERVLGVLQCKYVTGVIIPAISPDLLPFPIQSSEFKQDTSDYTVSRIMNQKQTFLERQLRKEGKAAMEKLLEDQKNPILF
ncbi:ethanolamine-phosphate cytidylyltransferase [Melampsora americana]|nr:ethanolamine-phosphate cytidylyltransferase [Melampsora americana]